MLIKKLSKILNLLIIKIILSKKIRKRADRLFSKTLREFKKKHKKPDRNELFLLVVKASHRVLGAKKHRGTKGHLKRQQIRKYLLLKNNIRDKYKIQK